MKLTLSSIAIASLGFLSTTASAWTLEFFAADNRHVTTHGRGYPVCNDLSYTPALNVDHVDFNPDTPFKRVSFTPVFNPGHYCAC